MAIFKFSITRPKITTQALHRACERTIRVSANRSSHHYEPALENIVYHPDTDTITISADLDYDAYDYPERFNEHTIMNRIMLNLGAAFNYSKE